MGSGNGGNGESALVLVAPVMEQGVVPRMPARPIHPLVGGQCIFVHAPQYDWHAHIGASVDNEAGDRLIGLV